LRASYRKTRDLWADYAVLGVKIALQAIFRGFMREARQTVRERCRTGTSFMPLAVGFIQVTNSGLET
jgi:hypothetical protein